MKLFKRRNWSNWEHILYVESFKAGIPTHQLLGRQCQDTGLTEYKNIYIDSCVHDLANRLTERKLKNKN